VNPFDWRGPQFLLFYAVFGAALWFFLEWFLFRRETGKPVPRLNLTDPYEIALLRGGVNESLRVAAISLVDRGLLKAKENKLKIKDKGAVEKVRRPIEKALLRHFSVSRTASSIFRFPSLRKSCEEYRNSLQARGLISDSEELFRRLPPYFACLSLALWVSCYKISLAISRDRPFGLLVILTIGLGFGLTVLFKRRRTALGDRVMEDLAMLFQQLKARAQLLPRGGDTNELALLTAVYGISSLSSEHGYVKKLFPKASDNRGLFYSSGCGSATSLCGSSGSSCGGSGSGCGGGGGGCGGCGGGH
jgi:uncharacterized protein (TIGR04222 family)